MHIYQNHITRCLHAFSFAGGYQPGSGAWIYRNVIDLRRPVPYIWPTKKAKLYRTAVKRHSNPYRTTPPNQPNTCRRRARHFKTSGFENGPGSVG